MTDKIVKFLDSEKGPKARFHLASQNELQFPVLISVPHAGRVYPSEIKENLAVPHSALLRLEDRYADRLAQKAISSGFTAIIAEKPRAWIDLNRDPTEIDPAMVDGLDSQQIPTTSRKVRGGLGLVPRRLTGTGSLWRENWQWSDIEQRINNYHRPYHEAIERILRSMWTTFGCAILLDLHSMPPLDDEGPEGADIVVGDRFGRSGGSRFSELSTALFKRQGYRAKLNHPYAGGYILERHGHPEQGIHALQIEVDRALYLDAELREPGSNIGAVAKDIERLAKILSDQARSRPQLEAAE